MLLHLSGSWLAEQLLKPEPAGRVCRSFQALVNYAMVTRTWLQPGEDTDCSAERLSPIHRALLKDPHPLACAGFRRHLENIQQRRDGQRVSQQEILLHTFR